MRFVDIEVDGIVARALLNEEKAPATCDAFWQALPFEGRAVHAQVSGEMFRMLGRVPMSDVEPEGVERFQHPGSVVYYAPIKEVAFCVGRCQFSAVEGTFALTPLAEVEGDFAAWAKKGDDLQFMGARPIRFRRAADQSTPFRHPSLTGRGFEIEFDGVVAGAVLLDKESPTAAAAFAAAMPLRGQASNSTWGGQITHFVADGGRRIVAGNLETGTTFHWPGYVYLDADGDIRICYGSAQENVQGALVPLIPVARIQGADLAAFQAKSRSQLIEGAKAMGFRMLEFGKGG
jgi:hypothetical protein